MRPIIYFSLAFAFSELVLMVVKRSKDVHVKTRKDKGSLVFLWLMITCGFFGGFFLSKPMNQFWGGFGIALIIGGLIIRWISILQLGRAFTVDVAVNNAAKLKTNGVYERIRHPSYLGMLLVIIGFSAAMSSIYSFLVLVIPVFLAILYRINVEEQLLKNEFGDSYSRYSGNTKKLIPGIY